MLDKLLPLGERRNAALLALKRADEKNSGVSPAERVRLHAAAKNAVIEWDRATQPDRLVPYLVEMARDATRYRLLRDLQNVEDRAAAFAVHGKDMDAAVDTLLEELLAAQDQPSLPLETKAFTTQDGTIIKETDHDC